ncbi:MAG: hypothetical protein VX640_10215 [Pseudomonadota bacterium]|nr:hypothetical protein [Pseudomonadota bacterium]
MRKLTAALTLIALAACGREEAPRSGETPAPVDAVEVAAVDQFGPVQGTVTGLALWTHPTLPFNGLVIAAGEAGLVAYNIEDGAEVVRDDRAPLDGVSIAYLGRGPTAQGFAATRTASGDARFRFYVIDNVSREFSLLTMTAGGQRHGARGFCLGRPKDGDGLALYEMTGSGWRATALTVGDGGVSTGAATEGKHKGGFNRCVVDELDGAVFAIDATGDVYRIEAGAAPAAPLTSTGVKNPSAIALALNGLTEGGATDECCGQIAVLDGANGVVSLYDHEDGHALGAIRMKASFDVEGVAAASALGFGYGNFGAIYRDGIVALATSEPQSAVRLAPLNGVMDALKQPLGETANPRDLAPQEEDDRVIDIDVVKP